MFAVAARAAASENIEISRIDGASAVPQNWPVKGRWSWDENGDHIRVLHYQLLIGVPRALQFKKSKSSQVRTKGDSLLVSMVATREMLLFTDSGGAPVKIRIEIKPSRASQIQVNGCKENDLGLASPPKLPENFVIGVSCHNVQGLVTVDVTAPSDFDWGETSLPEAMGKGEKFHRFDLGNIRAAKGSVLNFKLQRNGQDLPFAIVSQKKANTKEVVVDESKRAHFSGALSYFMLTAKTESASFSYASPGFFIEGWSPSLYRELRLGGDYASTIGGSKSGTSIEFSTFHLTASYPFGLGGSFSVDPHIFFINVSTGQDQANVTLQHSNFGAGVVFHWLLVKSEIQFGGAMSQFGSDSVSANLDLFARYTHPFSPQFSWLVEGHSQTFDTKNSSGKQVSFGQNYVSVGVTY